MDTDDNAEVLSATNKRVGEIADKVLQDLQDSQSDLDKKFAATQKEINSCGKKTDGFIVCRELFINI